MYMFIDSSIVTSVNQVNTDRNELIIDNKTEQNNAEVYKT